MPQQFALLSKTVRNANIVIAGRENPTERERETEDRNERGSFIGRHISLAFV